MEFRRVLFRSNPAERPIDERRERAQAAVWVELCATNALGFSRPVAFAPSCFGTSASLPASGYFFRRSKARFLLRFTARLKYDGIVRESPQPAGRRNEDDATTTATTARAVHSRRVSDRPRSAQMDRAADECQSEWRAPLWRRRRRRRRIQRRHRDTSRVDLGHVAPGGLG